MSDQEIKLIAVGVSLPFVLYGLYWMLRHLLRLWLIADLKNSDVISAIQYVPVPCTDGKKTLGWEVSGLNHEMKFLERQIERLEQKFEAQNTVTR